jgi:hypothetical protein
MLPFAVLCAAGPSFGAELKYSIAPKQVVP